jgi:DNA-damage-inducible protein D
VEEEKLPLTLTEQFENNTIRRVWYQDEWWYSLVDVMTIFAGTNRARKYWHDLKKKIIEDEGYSQRPHALRAGACV